MPGHSRGSICLHDRENKLLFTGDVVYDGHMIDWLPYSHVNDYISSCERLVGLVDSEQVMEAHTREPFFFFPHPSSISALYWCV